MAMNMKIKVSFQCYSKLVFSLIGLCIVVGNVSGDLIDLKLYSGIVNEIDNFEISNERPNAHIFRTNITDLSKANLRVETTVLNVFPDAKNCPLIFSVRQAQSVKSWALPLELDESSTAWTLNEGSHTICVSGNWSSKSGGFSNQFLIVVSTCSPIPVNYTLKFVADSGDESFILKVNQNVPNIQLSPAVTRFFRFDFTGSSDRVIVKIDSEDGICLTAAVQSPRCSLVNAPSNSPKYESPYRGFWQEMTNKSVIPVSKSDFPDGFFVGFAVHLNDDKCGVYKGVSSDKWTPLHKLKQSRLTTINIMVVEETPTDEYLLPLLYPLFCTIGLILFTLVIFATFTRFPSIDRYPSLVPCCHSNDERDPLVLNDEIAAGSSGSIRVSFLENVDREQINDSLQNHSTSSNGSFDHTDLVVENNETVPIGTSPLGKGRGVTYSNNSQWLTIDALINKNKKFKSKSMNKTYLLILTVGIFYVLPTIQLLYTYHEIAVSTGENDLCYRNYECSHKILGWDDFNHIYSNVVYLTAGVLFCLFVTVYKGKVEKFEEAKIASNSQNGSVQNSSATGVIYEFGVFYGLGWTLIIEGVLSACYHVCPTNMNFQFDTSFMYVLALLSAIKIYQFRHSCPICPTNTFGLLGLIAFLSVGGIILESKIYEGLFFAFHLIIMILLSIYMYHVGYVKDQDGNPITGYAILKKTGLKRTLVNEPFSVFKPAHGVRLFYVGPFILFNTGLNIWQFQSHNDFPMYLLYLFAGNMMLYFVHYFIMKVFHGEMFNFRSGQAFIYLMMSLVLGLWGVLNFQEKRYNAKISPAMSRVLNKPCDLGNFYDTHDLWHFLSAGSTFFFFMTLLTIDDGILEKPRNEIVAF